MTKYTDIGVEKHGHVGLIEIRKPPLNFFDVSLINQIADALEEFDKDIEIRAEPGGLEARYVSADRQRLLADAEPDRVPGRDPEELLALARASRQAGRPREGGTISAAARGSQPRDMPSPRQAAARRLPRSSFPRLRAG